MPTVTVSQKLVRVLEAFAPGEDLETKLENMTRERLESQLRTCNEALRGFETKYGMPFAEFAQAWQADKIPQRYSHGVERDFMEWEARHTERTDLLAAVQKLGRPASES